MTATTPCWTSAAAPASSSSATTTAATRAAKASSASLLDTEYRVYPERTQEEAAVIEWGHSAIISALDATVAAFGPQTSQAALLEVETAPVLAVPVDGSTGLIGGGVLANADQVHGNAVILTDAVLGGLDLALLAQRSGAAACIVVHVNTTALMLQDAADGDYSDDEQLPPSGDDEVVRLLVPVGREDEAATVDIPVVSISMAAANVLMAANDAAAATKTDNVSHDPDDPHQQAEDRALPNMPDRCVTLHPVAPAASSCRRCCCRRCFCVTERDAVAIALHSPSRNAIIVRDSHAFVRFAVFGFSPNPLFSFLASNSGSVSTLEGIGPSSKM
jgi:hypothetical protein